MTRNRIKYPPHPSSYVISYKISLPFRTSQFLHAFRCMCPYFRGHIPGQYTIYISSGGQYRAAQRMYISRLTYIVCMCVCSMSSECALSVHVYKLAVENIRKNVYTLDTFYICIMSYRIVIFAEVRDKGAVRARAHVHVSKEYAPNAPNIFYIHIRVSSFTLARRYVRFVVVVVRRARVLRHTVELL